MSAAETRAYAIKRVVLVAVAISFCGDIHAVFPVTAHGTEKLCTLQALFPIDGKSRFTVASKIVVHPPHPPDCQVASQAASLVRTLPTPGVPPVIFTCPLTSSFAHGLFVQIPTSPPDSTLIFSVPFVPITKSCASVVPMKLLVGVVPTFPVNPHPDHHTAPPPDGVSQVASPDALLVSTFPAPGTPPVISICHATLSIADVASQFVPIPIFHPLPYIQLPMLS